MKNSWIAKLFLHLTVSYILQAYYIFVCKLQSVKNYTERFMQNKNLKTESKFINVLIVKFLKNIDFKGLEKFWSA